MATTLKELGTNGSILTDSLFNNKSMVFNLNTHCDHTESILVQIPLMAYSTQVAYPSVDLELRTSKSIHTNRASKFIFQ